MKPNIAQNKLERWRQQDAGLRRALQLRNAGKPELPKGFEERMRQRLAEEAAKKKRRTLWTRIAAAAAMIAIVAGVSTLWWPDEQPQLAIADEQPTLQPSPQTDVEESIDEQLASTTSPQLASAQQQPAAKLGVRVATGPTHPKANNIATLPQPSLPIENEPSVSPEEATLAAVTDRPKEDPLPETIAEEIPSATTSTMPDRRVTVHSSRINSKLTETTSSKASHLLTIQTFMGTDGGDFDMDDNLVIADKDFTNQAYELNDGVHYPMMTKPANYYFPMGNGYTYDYGYYEDADMMSKMNSLPIKSQAKEEMISSTKHHLPVTIGASVQWYLSDHWAIETGLTYTRLASSFDKGTSSNYSHREQRIHYLGIPVRVHAQLLERKRWHLYAAAGVSTELPVAASVTAQTITPILSTDATKEHLSAPVQFATSLSAGVSFDITPTIGIYVEPSAQWFIPTNSDVETYRTKHPIRFTPQIGIRWSVRREVSEREKRNNHPSL